LILIQFGKQSGLLGGQRFLRPLLDFEFRLQTSIGADVKHFVAPLCEDAAHQQAAMAVRRVFLAAHQRYAELRHAAFQALHAALKECVAGAFSIKDAALVVIIVIAAGSAAQFFAQEKVLHAGSGQLALERSLVELRRIFRIGRRTRVDHDLNSVACQQKRKSLEGMRGMADGVDGAHRWLLPALRIPSNL